MSALNNVAGSTAAIITPLTSLAAFGPWAAATISVLILLVWLAALTVNSIVVPLVATFGSKRRSRNAQRVLELRSRTPDPSRKVPS